MMDLQHTRALITRHEGCRLKPYLDTVGKVTIGYGYNLTDRGITQATADDWLDDDLATLVNHLLAAYPWFPRLDAVRQGVVIDLVFNVGIAGFAKFVHLIAALVASDYRAAAQEIVESQIAPKRKGELAAMMLTGEWTL